MLYAYLSSNGLVLGNDPAVHLSRAEMFLAIGKIPASEVIFYPPLFHVWLATFLSFTGAASIEQSVFILKCVAVLANWLVILSVYLLAARFSGKKTGALAASFMLLILPFYEESFWGGYTSVASLALMLLLVFYLALNKKDTINSFVIFMLTFFMVLTHQLTFLLAVIILGPFVLFSLFRSKGRFSKAWLAVILGGVLAFVLYYAQTIFLHIGDIIMHLSGVQSLAYDIPAVNFPSFVSYFSFLLFFAALGVIIGFFKGRQTKKKSYYVLLLLSFLIPIILTQTYLFGLLLPFGRFIYYIVPFMAIFAAIAVAFIIDLFISMYRKATTRKLLIKILAGTFIILMGTLLVFRIYAPSNYFGTPFGTPLGEKLNQEVYYYSISDKNAYDAAVWLKENYPGPATTVVSEWPGSWFGLYSGKMTIAANNPVIQRNVEAECVLDLACEIEQSTGMEVPVTLIRAYEANGAISDETYVSIDGVLKRVSYFNEEGAFLSYEANGVSYKYALSDLKKDFTSNFQNASSPSFTIRFHNEQVMLTKTITVFNDTYPVSIGWNITPLQTQFTNVSLYLSNYFGTFNFTQAYLGGILNWKNPWTNPTYQDGDNWAVTEYTNDTIKDNFIGVFDDVNKVAFTIKFNEMPIWGNVGALGSSINYLIDAFRFKYQFDTIAPNQNASISYQAAYFSKSSYPNMPDQNNLKSVFDYKTSFEITTRDFAQYIKDSDIKFIVYSRSRFYPQLLESGILTLVYTNDGYVICSVKNSVDQLQG